MTSTRLGSTGEAARRPRVPARRRFVAARRPIRRTAGRRSRTAVVDQSGGDPGLGHGPCDAHRPHGRPWEKIYRILLRSCGRCESIDCTPERPAIGRCVPFSLSARGSVGDDEPVPVVLHPRPQRQRSTPRSPSGSSSPTREPASSTSPPQRWRRCRCTSSTARARALDPARAVVAVAPLGHATDLGCGADRTARRRPPRRLSRSRSPGRCATLRVWPRSSPPSGSCSRCRPPSR